MRTTASLLAIYLSIVSLFINRSDRIKMAKPLAIVTVKVADPFEHFKK